MLYTECEEIYTPHMYYFGTASIEPNDRPTDIHTHTLGEEKNAAHEENTEPNGNGIVMAMVK